MKRSSKLLTNIKNKQNCYLTFLLTNIFRNEGNCAADVDIFYRVSLEIINQKMPVGAKRYTPYYTIFGRNWYNPLRALI